MCFHPQNELLLVPELLSWGEWQALRLVSLRLQKPQRSRDHTWFSRAQLLLLFQTSPASFEHLEVAWPQSRQRPSVLVGLWRNTDINTCLLEQRRNCYFNNLHHYQIKAFQVLEKLRVYQPWKPLCRVAWAVAGKDPPLPHFCKCKRFRGQRAYISWTHQDPAVDRSTGLTILPGPTPLPGPPAYLWAYWHVQIWYSLSVIVAAALGHPEAASTSPAMTHTLLAFPP